MGGGPLDFNTVEGWFTVIAPFATLAVCWLWFKWYFRPNKPPGPIRSLLSDLYRIPQIKEHADAHLTALVARMEAQSRDYIARQTVKFGPSILGPNEYAHEVMNAIAGSRGMRDEIGSVVLDYAKTTKDPMEPKAFQQQLVGSMSVLPPNSLIKTIGPAAKGGVKWRFYTGQAIAKLDEKSPVYYQLRRSLELPIPQLGELSVELSIPRKLRTQHTHVIASTGFGKSQLFTNLILEDLEHDHAIVVIDSQNDLINSLATRMPSDRVLLVDPIFCPPVINLMAMDNDAVGLSLIEYMFNTHDAPLTSQQKMVFRFVGRLVLASDKPHIAALMVLLRTPEVVQSHYSHVLAKQSVATKEFFEDYCATRSQYAETRQQVSRRLLTLLENDVFQKMLATEDPRLNIAQAIAEKKIILINTAKSEMGEAATIFGRFWLAQVLRTVTKVPEGKRSPVHVYVDEFQDYAEDSPIIAGAFEQGRKYGLAMTIAHQGLSQLPDKLQATLMSNCAVRLAGGVSADDRTRIAKQMDVEPEFISRSSRGSFAAWFRDIGSYYYTVEFGQLDKMPQIEPLASIQDRMKKLYGPTRPRPDQQEAPGRAKGKSPPRDEDDVDGPGLW